MLMKTIQRAAGMAHVTFLTWAHAPGMAHALGLPSGGAVACMLLLQAS